jgi:DNA-binding CsgD family transcriptional regulator
MEPLDDPSPGIRRMLVGAVVVFGGIAVLVGSDLVLDVRAGTTVTHALVEGAAVGLALGGAGRAWFRWREETRQALAEATSDASRWQSEALRWRTEAEDVVKGLGAAIDRQFERWGLTPAEREVGLLLLKGLSHKEIAAARGTSERTAREQARAVYAKAGLAGRAELSAFFLEDLLLPANRS